MDQVGQTAAISDAPRKAAAHRPPHVLPLHPLLLRDQDHRLGVIVGTPGRCGQMIQALSAQVEIEAVIPDSSVQAAAGQGHLASLHLGLRDRHPGKMTDEMPQRRTNHQPAHLKKMISPLINQPLAAAS